jgi:hypothetical protein
MPRPGLLARALARRDWAHRAFLRELAHFRHAASMQHEPATPKISVDFAGSDPFSLNAGIAMATDRLAALIRGLSWHYPVAVASIDARWDEISIDVIAPGRQCFPPGLPILAADGASAPIRGRPATEIEADARCHALSCCLRLATEVFAECPNILVVDLSLVIGDEPTIAVRHVICQRRRWMTAPRDCARDPLPYRLYRWLTGSLITEF